jgi:hypothetical protein
MDIKFGYRKYIFIKLNSQKIVSPSVEEGGEGVPVCTPRM